MKEHLNKYEQSEGGSKVVQYEWAFDRKSYSQLATLRKDHEYARKREQLDTYTIRQLETAVGERFNVLLSKTQYRIKDNVIYPEYIDEPFMRMLIRGREYRRIHGNPDDFEREQAEVDGMAKIQGILCDPKTPLGTIMLSISSPGGEKSIYKHNFYDIFTLKEHEGRRFIEARRYSSGLSIEEYGSVVSLLSQDYSGVNQQSDVYFLSHPIRVDGFTADILHKSFYRSHEYVSEDAFAEILAYCRPFIHAYIQALTEEPYNEKRQVLTYRAILNSADERWTQIKHGIENVISYRWRQIKSQSEFAFIPTAQHIYALGSRPVREVSAGCGFSGGGTLNSFGDISWSLPKNAGKYPFSVSEFAPELNDEYGSREFVCPSCKRKNLRPHNRLLDACLHCGSSRVACKEDTAKKEGVIVAFPQKRDLKKAA